MKEIWKNIDGYENLYQISNLGNVISLRNNIILKPGKDGKGYCYVNLQNNNGRKCYKIHRLVAQAFIPNPNNYPQVNHKDGNKQNNCVDNLEWCTKSYNIKEAYRLGLMKPNHSGNFKKGHNIVKRIPINQYDLNGNLIKTWSSIEEASQIFKNISNNPRSNISGVVRGLRKTAFGYIWKYVK